MKNTEDTLLTYDNQLDFKAYARKTYGLPDFYFDYVTGVDAKNDRDIPGLYADGTMTWGEAVDILKSHFNS